MARTTAPDIQAFKAGDDDESRVRELIQRIKAGDEKAFGQLVDKYRNQVAALAYRMVGDYDEAADITQNVFLKMSKNLWRYDEKKKFYTWLYRITVNASIDYMRKVNRHKHEPLEHVTDTVETDSDDPKEHFQRRQVSQYISEVARTLSDKQRSAFLLRDVQGCKVDDIARLLNMPEATVRWYLHRARAKLRKELSRRCPDILLSMGIK